MSYAWSVPWPVRRHMLAIMRRGGGWGFGPGKGFPSGGPGQFFGGPRAGRGDVRLAILHLLAEQPMHGYQLMQEMSARTDGAWQPSPGSVYPTLQQLEDEGLVQPEERDGKKVYTLTGDGRVEVDSADDAPPWSRFTDHAHGGLLALRDVGFQVGAAATQVARAGSEGQVEKAREVLEEARRMLYQILGEDASPAD